MKGILRKGICYLAMAVMVGCSSNNYSETPSDQANAAREKIKQAQGAPPGMTK